jgi:hypothetical protein
MRLGASIKNTFFIALFLLLTLSIFAAPVPSYAQAGDPVVIETMRVDIWPEYDKPAVLVIYHITLADQTTLPANMSIRLPASVGEPHAVAMQDPNGLYNMIYNIANAGEWEEIQFQTPAQEIRIEYYDPGLIKDSKSRSFTFNWPGDYTINNLSLQVQQPIGAEKMLIKPDMGSGGQGDDGLTYFTYLAGKVDAGTKFSVSMTYEKTSTNLTSEGQFQTGKPSQPIDEGTSGRVNPELWVPWTLGGLGILLIAAGVYYFFRPGRTLQTVPARERHGRKAQPASDEAQEPARKDGVFCHQCGKRAASGDVFCRACGTKLR